MPDKSLMPQPEKSLERKPLSWGKGVLTWFSKETFSNWAYEQLGALWRSALMTAIVALGLRFYSTIPLDIRLIIGLFLLALVFISLERFIARRRNKQPSPPIDESAQLAETAGMIPVADVGELKDRVGELERENTALEAAGDNAIRSHEGLRTQLGRLQHQTETQSVQISFRDQELETLKTKYKWLYEIAEQDKRAIQKRVVVESCEPKNFNMESADAPFIEYLVWVFNASVYTISVQNEVAGRIYYREPNYPLMAAPNIQENEATSLSHGRRGMFKLYQWLAPHECDLMRKFTMEYPKQPTYTKVNLDKVSINFTVDYQDGTTEVVKLRLPPTADIPLWSGG